MAKLYAYVGPARILDLVRNQPPGAEIRSSTDARTWVDRHGLRGRELTATFVVDASGVLRLADRHSEHVACAAGAPVRSAGEMTFALVGARLEVTRVSNQSTGYCPEPGSWVEVKRALVAVDIDHPDGLTAAFDFRRCPACGQINLIKEGVFLCDACDAELPARWNFEG